MSSLKTERFSEGEYIMSNIKILDFFTITESRGGYYGDSVYIRVRTNCKTFWMLGCDAEDGDVGVAAQAIIENLMSAFAPREKADANIKKLMRIAEKEFVYERGNKRQVFLEDIFSDKTALKVYEQLKNDGAEVAEDGSHYIVLTPSFLIKWYEV